MRTQILQRLHKRPSSRRGFLQVDLVAALAIFAIGMVPLAYSFARERQVLKIEYLRSVADEIVDGEMEILAAGAGRDFPDGSQIYPVHCRAAAALPLDTLNSARPASTCGSNGLCPPRAGVLVR